MELHQGMPCRAFKSALDLHEWLIQNHASAGSFWLIIYKKASNVPSLTYAEALEELLCFGWIDSVPNKRDADSHLILVSPRSPKSNWSKFNKDKVEALLKAGRIQPSGQRMIDLAKNTGTWTALEEVDSLIVPEDLRLALEAQVPALAHFEAFSNSVRRGILEWIFNAKTPETRSKRIFLTADMAKYNLKANHSSSAKIYQEMLVKQGRNPST